MYHIAKHLELGFKISYYVKCEKCHEYTKFDQKISSQRCSTKGCSQNIQKKEKNYFVYINVEEQLRYEIKKHWETMKQYNNQCYSNFKGNLTDFQDSDAFRQRFTTSFFLLPLMVNTDGVAPFKSSTESIWPILLIQNYLPPEIRFHYTNIILVGLYFGNEKPEMVDYFQPFVEDMSQLDSFEMNIGKNLIHFKPQISTICLDMPAKAKFQQMKQYNGRYGCGYCVHPGKEIPTNKSGPTPIRYTNDKGDFNLRNHQDTIKIMLKFKNQLRVGSSKQSQDKKGALEIYKGIKGVSCAVAFDNFNIISGFCIDYMHLVLLGVLKTMLGFWLNTENCAETFYINPMKKRTLNERLLSIRPCYFITRRPTDITKYSSYKANECRGLLLYFLPVCLKNILAREYYDHFLLLSSAVYILLGTDICPEELHEAESKLRKFVHDYERLYKEMSMVMNVHTLLHLTDAVRNVGPLWTQSAFAFEGFNGVLRNYINGTTHVLNQTSLKYCLSKQFNESPNIKRASSDELSGVSFLIDIPGNSMDYSFLDERDVTNFESVTKLQTYKVYKSNGVLYTSISYTRAKTTADYFLKLTCGKYGQVQYYFQLKDEIYAVMDIFEEKGKIEHIIEVAPAKMNCILYSRNIVGKYITMKIASKQYIVSQPNSYEKD